jgi:hypothetical protein
MYIVEKKIKEQKISANNFLNKRHTSFRIKEQKTIHLGTRMNITGNK